MIAKILQNSSTFHAIDYNDRKVKENAVELLEASNFGYLDLLTNNTAADYKRYFELWQEKNDRIKSSQFHVTISCRGKEYSKEQLLDMGKQWLKEMGYEGLPTLIYFHKDTNNNHIHIITSRVGLDGKKIKDSNEKRRARTVINRIAKNDISAKARTDFVKALSYEYKNRHQFALIMESMGYKINITKDGYMEVCREGKTLLQKELKMIEWGSSEQKDHSNRKKQIQAILYKYSNGLTQNELSSVLHTKFGIEVVFHKANGHDKPYGYSLIDHKERTVYKGGEIMNMDKLLNLLGREIDPVKLSETMLEVSKDCTMVDVNQELKKYGFWLNKEGEVIHKRSKLVMGKIADNFKEAMFYNFRANKASEYSCSSESCAVALSAKFKIDREHITMSFDDIHNMQFYKKSVEESLNNHVDLENGLNVMRVGDKLFLIDDENKTIVDFDDLNLTIGYTRFTGDIIVEDEYSLIDAISSIIQGEDEHLSGGEINNELKKKRR